MDQANWNILIVFQALVSAFNLLLLNLVVERGFFVMAFIFTIGIYAGIFYSFFSGQLSAKHVSTVATFGFSTMIVMLFMYIQKRVHKEVFLEIK